MDADNINHNIEQFHLYNDYRYSCFINKLSKAQHNLIDALPMLFHLNMNLLPGYMGKTTPHGINGYESEKHNFNALKITNNQLDLDKIEAVNEFSIEAIYLQECFKINELVIWVIYHDELPENFRKTLTSKSNFIEKWYRKRNLNMKFRITNRLEIAHTYFDSVINSPHIDKQFFLDDFYSESILLAGKPAFFWLTNENCKLDYKTALDEKIVEDEFLDFSDNNDLRAQDYYSAALWHLLNISKSPVTSWLNLIILLYSIKGNLKHETYSLRLKNMVHSHFFENTQENPASLYASFINNIIHDTFTENSTLIDKTFTQVLCNLYRCNQGIYEKSIYDYFYEFNYCLRNASQRSETDLGDYIKSLESLYKLTESCFSMINKNITRMDNSLLTKTSNLFLLAERISLKLKHFSNNTRILNLNNINLCQDKIIIQYENKPSPEKWSLLIPQELYSNKHIKSFDTIIELPSWCYINQVIDVSTQISTNCPENIISPLEMINIVNILANELEACDLDKPDLNVFASASTPVMSIIFINKNNNKNISCDKITQLIIYNTGEFYTSQYSGIENLMACIYNWFNLLNNPDISGKPSIHVYNIKPDSSNTLKYNISDLLQKMTNYTNTHSIANTRTILKKDNKYYVSYFHDRKIDSDSFDNIDSFLKHLENPLNQFTHSVFTDTPDQDSIFGYLLGLNKKNTIQLFYYLQDKNVTTYIFDENGALFTYKQKMFNRQSFINHWIIFLHNMKTKCASDHAVEINQIIKITDNLYEHVPLTGKMLPSDDKYYDLDLKIIDKDHNINVSFTCENETFTSVDHGKDLYFQISRFISKNTRLTKDIPVYVSNIDLPRSLLTTTKNVKTGLIDYLKYKRNVENRINMKINRTN